MSALKDVLDGIELVAKSIDDMGKIIKAVQTGKGYLEKRYASTKEDVRGILEEMNKTLITTSSATSIITSFAFVDDPTTYASDLREFNNRIVDGKAEITSLIQDIDKYRGHCSKIKAHADKIEKGTNLDSIFRILGIKSQEENSKLSSILKTIYSEEQQHYLTISALCENLQRAIQHIHETLGGPGMLKKEKVHEAQALLTEYGSAFRRIESQANHCVFQLRQLIQALS